MNNIIIIIFFILTLLSFQSDCIVPLPLSMQSGRGEVGIYPTQFVFNTTSSSMLLRRAMNRIYQQIFAWKQCRQPKGPLLHVLTVQVASESEHLALGINESYSLKISLSGATLQAANPFGAIWGLQTFRQLVVYNTTTQTYGIHSLPIIITDSPRFPWRGLLIDTSRHYLSVSSILNQIEALSAAKMNVLHWHAVDAQSFPIQSVTFPFLSKSGAYAPDAIYTHNDIAAVVNYGKERGVRVVVEFDMPGHAASWGKGDASLIAKCPSYSANINNIPLNPTLQHTYDVIRGFLTEMSTLFPDQYIHLGGDEVVFGCWLEDRQIRQWMQNHGITTGKALQNYFEQRLRPIVSEINRTIVCWEELFEDNVNLDKNTVVQVWKNHDRLQAVVQAGFRGLISAGWYLGYQTPIPGKYEALYYDTWIDMYKYDPFYGLNLTNSEKQLILGGEVAMWGEQCDSDVIDGQVWPRAAAVGERLWSPVSVTDISDARKRLIEFSCCLKQIGIRSTPLAPGYCPIP
jgi:hexosaminidase